MSKLPEVDTQRRGRRRKGPKPKSVRRSLWGQLAVLALVPFIMYTVYTVAGKSVQSYRLQRDAGALRSEIEAEKRENLLLQQELGAARSDQQIEDAARRYLNLVKPGDTAIVITGPAASTPTVRAPEKPSPPDELPPWLDWLLVHLGL